MPDYRQLRDELADRLRDVPGVVSVGLGRSGRGMALVVVVNRAEFRRALDSTYKGVDVVVRDLGVGYFTVRA